MISMKKQRFSSHPRTKVRLHGPPGSAREQPCVNSSLGKYISTKKDLAEFIPVLTHSLHYPFTFINAILHLT